MVEYGIVSLVPSSKIRMHSIQGVLAALMVVFLIVLAAAWIFIPLTCGVSILGNLNLLNCETGFQIRRQITTAAFWTGALFLANAAGWVAREIQFRRMALDYLRQQREADQSE